MSFGGGGFAPGPMFPPAKSSGAARVDPPPPLAVAAC